LRILLARRTWPGRLTTYPAAGDLDGDAFWANVFTIGRMRCFRHTEADAVALCKHCMRGVCGDCVVSTPGGVACGDECAAEVGAARRVLLRSDRNATLQRMQPRFLALFLVAVGVWFVVMGALDGKLGVWLMGALFVAFGLGAFWVLRRVPDVEE